MRFTKIVKILRNLKNSRVKLLSRISCYSTNLSKTCLFWKKCRYIFTKWLPQGPHYSKWCDFDVKSDGQIAATVLQMTSTRKVFLILLRNFRVVIFQEYFWISDLAYVIPSVKFQVKVVSAVQFYKVKMKAATY